MSVATVNYLQFRNRETLATTSPLWQNFYVDRPSDFLPFGYGQGAGQTAGERSQANLVTPVNAISLNYAKEATGRHSKDRMDLATSLIEFQIDCHV